MAPRDVELLVDWLSSIGRSADILARQVETLHVVAYDRPAHESVPGRGSGDPDPLTGDAHARKIFAALAARAKRADDDLLGFRNSVLAFLNVGQVNGDLYGSDISPREYNDRLKNQRAQAAVGGFAPPRIVPQPKYPSRGDKR